MHIAAEIRNEPGSHDVTVFTDAKAQSVLIGAKPGGGSVVNGGELLCLALATCYCNDVYREAAQRAVPVDRVEVVVECDFERAGAAGKNLRYRVKIFSSATAADLQELIRHTDAVAEIHATLRGGAPVVLERGETETLPAPAPAFPAKLGLFVGDCVRLADAVLAWEKSTLAALAAPTARRRDEPAWRQTARRAVLTSRRVVRAAQRLRTQALAAGGASASPSLLRQPATAPWNSRLIAGATQLLKKRRPLALRREPALRALVRRVVEFATVFDAGTRDLARASEQVQRTLGKNELMPPDFIAAWRDLQEASGLTGKQLAAMLRTLAVTLAAQAALEASE